MKKQTNMMEVAAVAALAGAVAAGAVIAVYEVVTSEKGKAGIAKAKTGVVNTAGKVKTGVVNTADKVKAGVVNTADKVRSKLPTKKTTEEYDCDLGLEDDEVLAEEAALEA